MRIGKRAHLLLVLLALFAAAAGCRHMTRPSFRTPDVDLVDVSLDSDPTVNPRNPWRFMVSLAVNNPNPYPLDVASLAYSGMIGDEVVAEGEREEHVRVGASGVTIVKAPIVLNPGAFEAAARKVLARRSLPWEFNGSVGLRTPVVGTVRIPFSKAGTYDILYILRKMEIILN